MSCAKSPSDCADALEGALIAAREVGLRRHAFDPPAREAQSGNTRFEGRAGVLLCKARLRVARCHVRESFSSAGGRARPIGTIGDTGTMRPGGGAC